MILRCLRACALPLPAPSPRLSPSVPCVRAAQVLALEHCCRRRHPPRGGGPARRARRGAAQEPDGRSFPRPRRKEAYGAHREHAEETEQPQEAWCGHEGRRATKPAVTRAFVSTCKVSRGEAAVHKAQNDASRRLTSASQCRGKLPTKRGVGIVCVWSRPDLSRDFSIRPSQHPAATLRGNR